MSAPYDEHIGTHWEGCETERHHHQCALARLREKDARIARLEEAARAVIERWETPTWKDVGPTADVINKLRAALAKQEPRT